MSLPSGVAAYSIRQTRRPPLSYRTAAGGHCYAPVPVPEPRHVTSPLADSSNGSGFHKRRHGREHFPLASHRGGSFRNFPPRSAARIWRSTLYGRRAVRPAAPTHHTAADARLRTREPHRRSHACSGRTLCAREPARPL